MKILLSLLVGVIAGLSSLIAEVQRDTNIQINVLGVPPEDTARINSTYAVDSDGNIRMWAVGDIRAAGLTRTALSKKIENAYRVAQIYTSPTIQVQTQDVNEQLQQLVTVMGSVRRPGTMAYLRNMNLAQALAGAGGPTEFGTTKRVNVWREGKKYELSPLTNEKHKLERIYPDDVIEVDQVRAWEPGGE